jgi:inosine-uridine nucleoside N-ribohydrolase
MLLLWLALLAWSPNVVASPRRVIVDQDTTGPGTTNTISIAALLCAPDVIVEGITVATGDGWLAEEVLHVLRLLELLNRTDIPVIAGSAGPLLPISLKEVQLQTSLNSGRIGWMGAWGRTDSPPDPFAVNRSHFPEGMPGTAKAWTNISAAEFIAHTVRKHPGEVTILALAPMTNIALAMGIEPRLPQLARELVFMGGSIACSSLFPLKAGTHCDAGQPWSEFNFWFDSHAAQKVLRTVPYTTGESAAPIVFRSIHLSVGPMYKGRGIRLQR